MGGYMSPLLAQRAHQNEEDDAHIAPLLKRGKPHGSVATWLRNLFRPLVGRNFEHAYRHRLRRPHRQSHVSSRVAAWSDMDVIPEEGSERAWKDHAKAGAHFG